MGCDGGTIPKRDELVRTKQKPEQKDKDSVTAFKWRNCAINQGALKVPIVGCELGMLYSKESILEALLAKNLPENARHIRSLKDVKQLNFTPNRAKADEISGPRTVADYMCPVSGLEMNGKHRFVAIWSCGCVFSERALKHVPTTVCHVCQKPFETDDVIILNAEGDDLTDLETRMDVRRVRAKAAKKEKTKNTVSADDKSATKRPSTDPTSAPSSSKMPKPAGNGTSNVVNINGKVANGKAKKSKVEEKAHDPKDRESYKSLFTSHETAKNKPKAHWVTFNPFFN